MKPYTYLIGWSELEKYYYGVRFANKVEPEKDLWVKYFTSSKHVKNFRESHGEPDIILIDMVFEIAQDAIDYEKLKIRQCLFESDEKNRWLNKAIGATIVMDDQMKQAMKERMNSYEMKSKLREATRLQFLDPVKRKKHKDSCVSHKDKIWINDGINHKRINPEEYDINYSNWNKGRIIPKDSNFGNYDKSGSNNPFYGKTHTEETKMKISNNMKRKNTNV